MKQFGKILKFELKSYFKNKIFVGTTIFLVLALAAVMFYPHVYSLFEGDADPNETERAVMVVYTEDTTQAELVQQAFTDAFPEYLVQESKEGLEKIKERIISGDVECAFVMKDETSYTYYVDNLSLYDVNTSAADEVLQKIYQISAMTEMGMTQEEAGDVLNIQITSEVENLGKNQSENFLYTYIMIFALYMVVILYGQMVATNVATEKSSRAMEVLITSAKPTAMMFGKVLASCLAGLIQLIAVFGSALVFYNLNQTQWGENAVVASLFNIPPELFVYMLIFFTLGFLIYAFLFGAIGSTISKLEDVNTAVMPLTFLFIIAFMVVMFSLSSSNVDNTVMLVCSYIPFTSPMAMFTRIAMSTIPIYEVLLSIAILIVSTVGVGVLAAKIYRVGVLLYGTTPKIGSVVKSIWKA